MRDEPEQVEFPGRLADAIAEAYSHRPVIPAAVDQAVVGAARAEFGRRRRMRLIVRIGGGVAAALAASVVLMVLLRPAPTAKPLVKGDLDGSGKADMVDAMLLARRVRAGEKLDAALDVSGDGRVDQVDADELAKAAVKMGAVKTARLPTLKELGIASAGAMPTHAAVGARSQVSAIGVGGHVQVGVARACPPEPMARLREAEHPAARVGMAPGGRLTEVRQ